MPHLFLGEKSIKWPQSECRESLWWKCKYAVYMIIVNLYGGLGNVMFQYALGRHLSLKNKAVLKFDITAAKTNPLGDYSLSLEAFHINIHDNLASADEIAKFMKYKRRTGRRWFLYNRFLADNRKYIQQKRFCFEPEILHCKDDFYLEGWWQTERYFVDIRDVLLQDFTVRNPLQGKNKEIAEQIRRTNAISVHVRRCDYVTNPITRAFHGELTKTYYDEALFRITANVENPVLFVFSDDTLWVAKNMPFPSETVYIGWNGSDPHEDMRLMSMCAHNIVANSSFGWWGAWLNRNPNKIVIAPRNWVATSKLDTKDVVPDSWIKI